MHYRAAVAFSLGAVMLGGCVDRGEQPRTNPSNEPTATASATVAAERPVVPKRREEQAMALAFGDDGRRDDLAYLYFLCRKSSPKSLSYLESGRYLKPLREAQAASILCPQWALAEQVAGYVQRARTLRRLKRTGRIFTDGSYGVGNEIAPGDYYVRDPHNKGCSWSRKNKNGFTLDKHAYPYGSREIRLTIFRSDYSFTSEGCGEWWPVGME